MARSVKRNMIYQEALRRLRNISPQLEWDEAIPHMNVFSNMLRISGCSKDYRKHVISGAIDRMREVRCMVSNGDWESQYRNRETIVRAQGWQLSWNLVPEGKCNYYSYMHGYS